MIPFNKLTDDQQTAFKAVERFIKQDEHRYMTITGYAGTGKTTLLDNLVGLFREQDMRYTVTATTNKAVKVLRDRIDTHRLQTIHKALNIKPVREKDLELFEQVKYDKELPIASYDIVVVDECSMISVKLLEVIKDSIGERTKVLFTGDYAQLPPIREGISPTFHYPSIELKTIVRHDDTLARSAALVRNKYTAVDFGDIVNGSNIFKKDKAVLRHHFKDWRNDPDSNRMIAWTNARVIYWNKYLRRIDFDDKSSERFLIGDIVIANSPCIVSYGGDKSIVLNNSEEAVVKRVKKKKESFKLMVEKEGGAQVELEVVKKEHQLKLDQVLRKYAKEKKWFNFWKLKEQYHDIRHSYSMTAHKAQGSTFENVFIDMADISRNPDIRERNKLLYTAITRASKTVTFI